MGGVMRQEQRQCYEEDIQKLVKDWIRKNNGIENSNPYDLLSDLIINGISDVNDKDLETLKSFLQNENKELGLIAKRVVLKIISHSPCFNEIGELKPEELKLRHVLVEGYVLGQDQSQGSVTFPIQRVLKWPRDYWLAFGFALEIAGAISLAFH